MEKQEENHIYKKDIIEMVKKINDTKLLKRIYNLVEYLYIHK